MRGKPKNRSPLLHVQTFPPEPRRPVGDNPDRGLTEDAALIQIDKPGYAAVATARDCGVGLQTGISGAQ
jgi:hypothetical protein